MTAKELLKITTPQNCTHSIRQIRKNMGRVPIIPSPQPEPIQVSLLNTQHVSTYLIAQIYKKQAQKILIDTGAAMCVISNKFLRSIGYSAIKSTNIQMVLADRGKASALGVVNDIPITLGKGDQSILLNIREAIVTDAETYAMILGTNWLGKVQAQVDIHNQKLKFTHEGQRYSINIASTTGKPKMEEEWEDSEDSGTESDDESEDEEIQAVQVVPRQRKGKKVTYHLEDRMEDYNLFEPEEFSEFTIGAIENANPGQEEISSEFSTPDLRPLFELDDETEAKDLPWDHPASKYQTTLQETTESDDEWNQ